MKSLTIKPSLACIANCPGCASRRSLHRSLRGEPPLTLDEWVRTIEEGRSLGAELLTISGGEPTLYRWLSELIHEAKRLGYTVILNTNGGRIDRRYAETLIESRLDAVRVSIYSHRAEVHDTIRRSKDLFHRACRAVKIFKELQNSVGTPRVWTQSVILRENIRSLDELVKFHYELGSESMLLSYLEGDFDHRMAVSEGDIITFRESVLPRIVNYFSRLDASIRDTARQRIRSIYDPAHGSSAAFSRGVYWSGKTCEHPRKFALILANGDVHPCDMVEYTHEPVMGNLLRNRLTEIWRSEAWRLFRDSLHDKCRFCPKNLHTTIPLRPISPDAPMTKTILQRVRRSSALAGLRRGKRLLEKILRDR
jgi:MoaA/NifB/PqqE/SkfB family radical SAM enzyme